VSILKPEPVFTQPTRNLCPICGQASYSRDGIHPQCSLNQADAVRYAKVREKRKAEVKVKRPKTSTFTKRCPTCGTNLHVRVNQCACGFEFQTRQR
jgi:hypothetical protein